MQLVFLGNKNKIIRKKYLVKNFIVMIFGQVILHYQIQIEKELLVMHGLGKHVRGFIKRPYQKIMADL